MSLRWNKISRVHQNHWLRSLMDPVLLLGLMVRLLDECWILGMYSSHLSMHLGYHIIQGQCLVQIPLA